MIKKLELVIFDISGTIWDDLDQVFHANYDVLNAAGHNTCPQVYNEEYRGKKLTIDALKANAAGSCVEQFRRFGMTQTDDELIDLYQQALEEYAVHHPVSLYDGVLDLLNFLENEFVALSVVSSHPVKRLEIDFSRLGLRMFDPIIGNSHNKVNDIIEVAKKGSLNKNNVVYIGDTFSDMVAANNAQVVPIGVSYGYQQEEKIKQGNPREVFSSVHLLKTYLETLI